MVLKPRPGIKYTATNEKFTRGSKQIWTDEERKISKLKDRLCNPKNRKKNEEKLTVSDMEHHDSHNVSTRRRGEREAEKNVQRNKSCKFPRF